MPTSFKVFSLGVHTLIDPTEGNENAENASALVGVTVGSASSPLHQEIRTFAPGSAGTGGGNAAIYDQNNNLANDQFTIDGGADQTFDAASAYTITLNYADGTSATITGVILQDTVGNSYLLPNSTNNANQAALEAKAIESISIDALVQSSATGVDEDRIDGNYVVPDATVDGTAGNDVIDASYGDPDGDKVDGFDGDVDTIDAGGGDDTVYGAAGADSIFGDFGNDSLYGGDGDDTLVDNDLSVSDDRLFGGAGNDSILAGSGSNLVEGGIGNDIIDTADHSDTVYGGAGVDSVDGGGGNDTLYGDDGGDTLEGGGTGGADDLLYGGAGNDVLTDEGNSGSTDTLYGGSGADSINGGQGNDGLFGGTGNDTLVGGTGDDTLYAGFGSDTFDGGDDTDTLDIVNSAVSGFAFNIDLLTGSDQYGNAYVDIENVLAGSAADSITGSDGANLIYGGAGDDIVNDREGDDTVYGGAGNDTLVESNTDSGGNDLFYGGAGDDRINVGNGGDTAFGGDGSDTFISLGSGFDKTVTGGEGGTDSDLLTWSGETDAGDVLNVTFSASEAGSALIRGQTVTFSEIERLEGTQVADIFNATNDTVGTSIDGQGGDDTITGGTGTDTFDGGAGADVIYGGGGDDNIDAGDEADAVYGGAGSDFVSSSQGNDTVYGGAGDDFLRTGGVGTAQTIFGGLGNDDINTFGQNDTVYGGDGDEIVRGDSGFETFYAGAGDDTIFAGSNNDTVFGGDGTDILYASNGNDTIISGTGADTVYGGFGADTVILEDGFGADTIYSGEGGTDSDTLNLTALGTGITVTFTGDEQGSVTNGTDTATFFGIENIALSEQDDVFDATANLSNLVIFGGGGDDSIIGSDFNGVANDSVADTIYGGAGNDTIDGGQGKDTLYGGTGNDRLLAGFDDFTGDLFYGGDGIDTYMIDGTTVDGFGFNIDLVAGSDTFGNQYNGIENVIGGTQDDSVLGDGSDNTLEGRAGNDTLAGGAGSDLIYGGDGADSLTTGTGEDTLYGGSGDDNLANSAGNDTLFGGAGNDTITASLGDDLLYGGTGNDLLYGGQDEDTLYGGTGSEALYGGIGNDLVYGGDDQDTIFVDDSFGTDTVYGGEGGTDSDTLDLTALGTGITVTFTGNEQGVFTDGTDTGTFFGIENVILTDQNDDFDASNDTVGVSVDGRAGDDTLTGSQGSDLVYGGSGNDAIDGGEDTDTLYGGTGVDSLDGGNAGDELFGGADGDSISGGGGADTVYGGDGNDSIDAGSNPDVVYGGAGTDTINSGSGFDVVYGGDGADVIRTSSGGQDTLYGDAGADDIDGGGGTDTLFGGSGNDTLAGDNGNDTLTGGTGDDTFVLSAAGGDDIVTDFAVGTDRLDASGLSDSALGAAADGTVTADEVVVTGGSGSAQVLTFPNGETLTVPDGTVDQTSQQTQFASLVTMGVPPCFAPGTLIATPDGEIPVEQLKPGDLVLTADRGPQPLRWIGRREVAFDPDNPRGDKDKPIEIKLGALGRDADGPLPRRALIVSPQHRIVLGGPAIAKTFDAPEVFAIARALTGLDGVRIMKGKRRIAYFALLFDRHEVIFAEGAPTESFRPGPVALADFTLEHRAQIFRIYPGLADDPEAALGPPARPRAKRREVERFIKKQGHSGFPDLKVFAE